MAAYRLFGAETSPYSLKVRAFLRYKGADFEWIQRSKATQADFAQRALLPTVPLLVAPDGAASQDSTSMLGQLEKALPAPEATPSDPALAALAPILEDYADEWLNKAMFQQRWGQSPDREAAAQRLIDQLFPGISPEKRTGAQTTIVERMESRLELVGAQLSNEPVLAASYRRFAELLNAHLEQTLFIFGGRPSVADFALAGQLQQMLADPTPGEWLRDRAPFVAAWCEFMEAPTPGAPFADLETLKPTLLPLFRDEVAASFLPWTAANSEAFSKRRKQVAVDFPEGRFEQGLQRYAARSFRAVQKAVRKASSAPGLAEFLSDAGLASDFGPET